jgi:hypothetical protein
MLNLPRNVRLAALILLTASIFLLGLSGAVWATPQQRPVGQTVPTATDDDDDDDDDDDNEATATAWAATATSVIATRTAIADETAQATAEPTATEVAPPTPTREPVTGITIPPWQVIVTPDDFVIEITIDGTVLGETAQLPNYVCENSQFNVAIFDLNGNPVSVDDFQGPIEIRYNVPQDVIDRLGGDLSRLVILVYDLARQTWVPLETVVNPDGSISAFVNYTGLFTVCELIEIPVELPVTGIEPIPAMLPDTGGQQATLPASVRLLR